MALAMLKFAPEDNLSRYLQDIRKYPMLTAEDELKFSKA
ncbi:RNA polymerase factor sigma-32, partial [Acidisoma cellulosilytica]|nr:RNA polymerase factor sigma-32 [Acidisoma cellulosilyticum]